MPLVALAVTENVRVLLKRRAGELGLLPEVRREETVGVGDGNKGSLEGILERLGRSRRGSVDVVNTCQLQETLHGWRGDKAGTTWSRNELTKIKSANCINCIVGLCWESTHTNGDGTALARLLDWDGVWVTEVGAPVATTNWHHRELRDDDRSADGSCNFLGGLDAETNVALAVSNDDNCLETGALTSTSLLLDWLDLLLERTLVCCACQCGCCGVSDLHDLVLELWQKEVDDLVLLDRQRVQVDLLHALDLAGLDETTELGDRLPLLLVALCAASTSSATTTAASATVTSTTVATGPESATTGTSSRSCATSVCHCAVVL